MIKRTHIGELDGHIGEEVMIKGWVNIYRDQGKMVFIDFRDATGLVQGVVLPDSPALTIAKECRSEWVVEVKGVVNKRPEKMAKHKTLLGEHVMAQYIREILLEYLSLASAFQFQ